MLQTGLLVCGETNRWADTVEQVKTAESLGYDSVWLAESHFRDEKDTPAPLIGLAALAAMTERVLLGSAVVIAPLHHPLTLAEETALVQDFSGGRFICGLGLGYREEEFSAFGVSKRRRPTYLEETVALLRLLWTEENANFNGEIYQIEDVSVAPKPVPVPPIWIGGWASSAVTRAARLADAWFPGPTADLRRLRECYSIYDQAREATDMPPTERPLIREVWVGETQTEIERGKRHLSQVYEDEYRAVGYENVGDGDVLRDRAFVGSPQQVAEGLARWRGELGFDHIIARMHVRGSDQRAVLRSMELFTEHVKPALAGLR